MQTSIGLVCVCRPYRGVCPANVLGHGRDCLTMGPWAQPPGSPWLLLEEERRRRRRRRRRRIKKEGEEEEKKLKTSLLPFYVSLYTYIHIYVCVSSFSFSVCLSLSLFFTAAMATPFSSLLQIPHAAESPLRELCFCLPKPLKARD